MKLVIYNKENSQPIGQRNGERTLRFNRENGIIYISKAFASELGIKDIDKVQFANDLTPSFLSPDQTSPPLSETDLRQ